MISRNARVRAFHVPRLALLVAALLRSAALVVAREGDGPLVVPTDHVAVVLGPPAHPRCGAGGRNNKDDRKDSENRRQVILHVRSPLLKSHNRLIEPPPMGTRSSVIHSMKSGSRVGAKCRHPEGNFPLRILKENFPPDKKM